MTTELVFQSGINKFHSDISGVWQYSDRENSQENQRSINFLESLLRVVEQVFPIKLIQTDLPVSSAERVPGKVCKTDFQVQIASFMIGRFGRSERGCHMVWLDISLANENSQGWALSDDGQYVSLVRDPTNSG